MESLLLPTEVAQILRLKPTTVYLYAKQGKLPHVRITKGANRSVVRFRRGDIEKLIRATRQSEGGS